MPDVTFNGPAGRIEGKYFQSQDSKAPVALVLHPHPQHGGTMNNKVAYRIYESFAKCGFSVLRFNFRGVGKSEGEFDHGIGELSDAAAALDWLQAQNPNNGGIWMGGFSFGSWIMLQLLMRRPDVKRFIAVSTPSGRYDHNFLSPCPSSGLFLVGTNDEITPYHEVEDILKKTTRQKGTNLHYAKVQGADHFYTDYQEQLAQTLCQYINSNLEK